MLRPPSSLHGKRPTHTSFLETPYHNLCGGLVIFNEASGQARAQNPYEDIALPKRSFGTIVYLGKRPLWYVPLFGQV